MRRIKTDNLIGIVTAKAPVNQKNKRLRGAYNYDVLSNPFYNDRFCYIPCTFPKRSDYTISDYKDSYMKVYSNDIVRLACDLAYIPCDQALKLKFDEEFLFRNVCELRSR